MAAAVTRMIANKIMTGTYLRKRTEKKNPTAQTSSAVRFELKDEK
jgi:hypothetical protein